ncbi:MAG: outer membrane beta-barrel protein [Candidatus Zixiibacteriota bacterium]|nr:MAG: outer membrane beta-barrel protein [candidate division Zixibacteria bacterium]
MKKLLASAALCLILTLFASTLASGDGLKGRFAFTGMGHLGLPLGDFAGEKKGMARTGYGFGLNLEYFLSDNLALGGSFSYLAFGSKTDHFEEDIQLILYQKLQRWYEVDADVKQELSNFGVFGKYLISPYSRTCPYAKFGMGLGKYSLTGDARVDGLNAEANASFDSEFYVNIGPGIHYRASDDVAFVFEVTYVQVFTDEAKSEAVITAGTYTLEEDFRLNSDAQYFGVYAGASFFFGGR